MAQLKDAVNAIWETKEPEGGAQSVFWQTVNFIVSLAVSLGALTLLFATFFRWFPDGPVTWQDAWRGGLATAVPFNWQGSTYGAAASVVVLPIWVYYSAQIVLFGGEITPVYAQQRTVHKQQT